MPVSKNYNGTVYQIPVTDDRSWGAEVSNYLADIAGSGVTLTSTQTLTNKTLTSPTITGATITTGTFTGDVDVSSGTFTLANDQISGNKIDGGTISNFASTGIDDNASGLALTIASDGTITLAQPLPLTSGGTGATTAEDARTALELGDAALATIGVDVQAYDAGLDDLSGLTPTDGNLIVGDGSNWTAESGVTARQTLGLIIGTDVQAYDADTAKTDIAQTYTAKQQQDITVLTPAASTVWNIALYNRVKVTADQNIIIEIVGLTGDEDEGDYEITINPSTYTVSWSSDFDFDAIGGAAPTLTASKPRTLGFYCDGTTMYLKG